MLVLFIHTKERKREKGRGAYCVSKCHLTFAQSFAALSPTLFAEHNENRLVEYISLHAIE
jgi:hypothetical protein